MAWQTYALIGLTAVAVTITVIAITQANKEADTRTIDIEEQNNRLGSAQTIHDLNDSATLRRLTNEGL